MIKTNKKPAQRADPLLVFGYSLHIAVRGRTLQTPVPVYQREYVNASKVDN